MSDSGSSGSEPEVTDQFPGLLELARKYLATLAGNTESERLFSEAGFVVDDERKSLKTGKVEDILFLYENTDKFQ